MKTILSTLNSKAGVHIINRTTGQTEFLDLDSTDVDLDFSSTLHDHTTDDGGVIVDSKMILPTKIKISAYLSDMKGVDRISNIFSNKSELYSIIVNSVLLADVVCTEVVINDDPEFMSVIPTTINFQEVITRKINAVRTEEAADVVRSRSGTRNMEGAVSITLDEYLAQLARRQ